jgi:hypothetical protein
MPAVGFHWTDREWDAALKGLAVGAVFFLAFSAVHLRWRGTRDGAGLLVGLLAAAVVVLLLR